MNALINRIVCFEIRIRVLIGLISSFRGFKMFLEDCFPNTDVDFKVLLAVILQSYQKNYFG